MTANFPGASIQVELPKAISGEDCVTMKITGVLVVMLVQINCELYGKYIVCENGCKVLYMQVLRAIYGMLQSALLWWYKKIWKDLKKEDFIFNAYDPCVANHIIRGSQQRVRFHVNDLKSSHKNSKVNDEFAKWLEDMYS